MAAGTTVVLFPKPRRSRKTRYQPTVFDGHVVISADRHREMDVEKLCERLSPAFLRHIMLMADEEITVLEILASGVYHSAFEEEIRNSDPDGPHPLERPARQFKMRRTRKPAGRQNARGDDHAS